ncbi:MAG: sodium:calcium antiporter [Woeseiaceae bacterium]
MDIALLIVGLAGLWIGTELTIRGAVSVAHRFRVPEFIVGVVILSIGSDLPELAIAVDAGVKNLAGGDYSDVVVGSALGSSLGQISFVLGVAGLLAYLTLPKDVVYRHGSTLLGSLLLVALFGYDGEVTRTEGIALLLVYAIYLVALFNEVNTSESPEQPADVVVRRSMLYLIAGLVVVVVSAEVTVKSAVVVAHMLGLSDAVVAILLIGLGSSLPELTISIAAVMKGHNRMSVGNVIGSNVFDTDDPGPVLLSLQARYPALGGGCRSRLILRVCLYSIDRVDIPLMRPPGVAKNGCAAAHACTWFSDRRDGRSCPQGRISQERTLPGRGRGRSALPTSAPAVLRHLLNLRPVVVHRTTVDHPWVHHRQARSLLCSRPLPDTQTGPSRARG